MAKFDANGLAVVMLDPVRDKTRACTGGGGGDTCNHGLSRRSPRVKPPAG